MVISKVYLECEAEEPYLFSLSDIVDIGLFVLNAIAFLKPSVPVFLVLLC